MPLQEEKNKESSKIQLQADFFHSLSPQLASRYRQAGLTCSFLAKIVGSAKSGQRKKRIEHQGWYKKEEGETQGMDGRKRDKIVREIKIIGEDTPQELLQIARQSRWIRVKIESGEKEIVIERTGENIAHILALLAHIVGSSKSRIAIGCLSVRLSIQRMAGLFSLVRVCRYFACGPRMRGTINRFNLRKKIARY